VITALRFSPDGQFLAVSGYHEILLHRSDGSGLVARLIGQSERIQSLAFSPDGRYLAASGGTPGQFGEVQIWNCDRRCGTYQHGFRR
jgi:WD40 repeat protein